MFSELTMCKWIINWCSLGRVFLSLSSFLGFSSFLFRFESSLVFSVLFQARSKCVLGCRGSVYEAHIGPEVTDFSICLLTTDPSVTSHLDEFSLSFYFVFKFESSQWLFSRNVWDIVSQHILLTLKNRYRMSYTMLLPSRIFIYCFVWWLGQQQQIFPLKTPGVLVRAGEKVTSLYCVSQTWWRRFCPLISSHSSTETTVLITGSAELTWPGNPLPRLCCAAFLIALKELLVILLLVNCS